MRHFSFSIAKQGKGLARAGVIHTPHGDIETPAFTPVATKATVKALTPEMLAGIGARVLITNAYHLYLSPGPDLIEEAGGVGAFMGWKGPTMTDSGGFQVFSLGEGFGKKLSKFMPEQASPEEGVAVFDEELATSHGKLAIVDDEGVSFTSHADGSLHRFTPERSIEIQHKLGADIIFAFDECTAPTLERDYQKEAMDRTHAWGKRSLVAHRQNLEKGPEQGLYGIVQGGRYADLREESARTLGAMDFDGYGIGGSFSKHDLIGILEKVNVILPEEKPRHLLGIGEPEDLFLGVAAGIDTFDCVLPTRNARNGTLYTKRGKINLENAKYARDFTPVDSECPCYTCTNFSKAYLSHLYRSKEMLAGILGTLHNTYFLVSLAKDIRQSIMDDQFGQFRDEFLKNYKA